MPATGACKICESVYADIVNRLIAQEKNEADVKRILREIDPDFYWSRKTFYTHKDHVTHPLISAAKRAQQNPVVVPKTTEGFLELVRDAGARRVAEDPDSVKLRDALKASEILEKRSSPKDQMFILLAKAMTHALPETIQGEFAILPPEELEGGDIGSTQQTGGGGRPDPGTDRLAEDQPEDDRREVDGDYLDAPDQVRYAGG